MTDEETGQPNKNVDILGQNDSETSINLASST